MREDQEEEVQALGRVGGGPAARRLGALLLALGATLAAITPGAAGGATEIVGRSVQGRPIVAVQRGDAAAPLTVLVVGCIHGDETAGVRVARQLIAGGLSRRASFWIVPTLNPDGVAAGSRGNAHGVDLNRNFPFDWRHLGGGEYSGTRPLSEPESRAASRLIARIRPDVTIWFHQPFGLIDRSGGNPLVERRFAELSGLPLVRLRRYPGSATSWQNHALPGTAFVAELPPSVGGHLVARAAAAVRSLAAELGSPLLDGGEEAS